LTRSAIFLVVTINPGAGAEATVRGLCADLSSLLRGSAFAISTGSCPASWGRFEAWDRLFGAPRPKDLHPFREICGVHTAVSTPGDILFHLRAGSMDLCFELATHIMSRLQAR
jgi:putative iron-dependent peroxidase